MAQKTPVISVFPVNPADLFQNAGRRGPLDHRDNNDLSSPGTDRIPTHDLLLLPVSALDDAVRPQVFDELQRRRFVKNGHVIDGRERGDYFSALLLGNERPPVSLDCPDGGVPVQAEYEDSPRPARLLQISDMAHVQDVEATVGECYFLPLAPEAIRLPLQFFPGQDLFHHFSPSPSVDALVISRKSPESVSEHIPRGLPRDKRAKTKWCAPLKDRRCSAACGGELQFGAASSGRHPRIYRRIMITDRPRKRQDGNRFRPCLYQDGRAFRQRASRGEDIIHQEDPPAGDLFRLPHRKGSPDVGPPLLQAQADLRRRWDLTPQRHEVEGNGEPLREGARQDRRLIETPLLQPFAVQRDRQEQRKDLHVPDPAGEIGHDSSQDFADPRPPTVLEEVDRRQQRFFVIAYGAGDGIGPLCHETIPAEMVRPFRKGKGDPAAGAEGGADEADPG